jgi:hypothetical protein|tara:strand:+ start:83 stop:739 length:657 start_codon:yes stop_codon:yes gene_type:complete
MSILNKYNVESIKSKETHDWLLNKHYARRICSISYAFGLYNDGILNGVCTFGFPPNYNYNNGNCVFNNYNCLTLELNRLVVNDGLHKNTLSYFVSQSLRMLPKPSCIVSYADQNQGHNGYIYQATNWIYTGTSTPKYKYVFEDGSTFDIRRGLNSKGKIKEKILIKPTHRYLYFNGSKTEIKKMKKHLKMKIFKYPKGNNKKYDADYSPKTQINMFIK